jgi:hypothetical protein
MDLALVVDVFWHDGRRGRSTNVILNPTREATHLAVALEAPTLPDRFSRPHRPIQRPSLSPAWTYDTVGLLSSQYVRASEAPPHPGVEIIARDF